MQKLFIKRKKKEKERRVEKEKMDKCSRYLKQWVLRCPPKKEMNKIAHVFLQRCLKILNKRNMFQGAQ